MGRIHRYRTALSRHHRSAGYGIHSPFAFNFVKNVLRERLPYYSYEYIEELRHAVIVAIRHHFRHPHVISFKEAKMLFRITNFFKPSHILQIGTTYGISSASMLAVSSDTSLFLYEPHLSDYPVIGQVLQPFIEQIDCYYDLQVASAEYQGAVAEATSRPFVLLNSLPNEQENACVVKLLHDVIAQEGVIVMCNLNNNKKMASLFEKCKSELAFGQTFTNEKVGLIVASSKLQIEHFFLWF